MNPWGAAFACPLFDGLLPDEADTLLQAANARAAAYPVGGVLLAQGAAVRDVGVLLTGAAEASSLSSDGRRAVLARLAPGSVFGDVLAGGGRASPVSVVATEPASALFASFAALIRDARVARNLLGVFSAKYFELHDRVACLTEPTLRGKITRLLSRFGKPGEAFNVPFDRAAMADYLNADRAALSRELSRMKREGLIDYYKDTFKLLT